eukprot:13690947-Ditylum_brightwellii.AAC.1
MKEYNISIFGFAETKVAWSPILESTAKSYGKKIFKQFQSSTCSSDDQSSTIHLPGGICMGTT